MASAYSTPTQYAAPVPTKDINLINQVLAAKQQRFDVNSARIEEAVSQVSNIDLLREPEQIKLKERLNGLLNQVAQGSKLDLTDNSTAKMLQSSVSSVIDEDLLKHVGIARQKKAFDQRISELKKDDQELYNDANLQNSYYEAGLSDYMKGNSDDIKALQYNPYYDINKNLNEPLEKFATKLGFVKDIDEDGNEYFVSTRETNTLGADKIKNFIRLRMEQDPKLRKQLQINARAEVNFDMSSAKQALLSVRDSSVKKYEKEKAKITAQLSEVSNPQILAELQAEQKSINQNISLLKNSTFDTEQSVDNAITNRYSENLVDMYAKTYAKQDVESIEYTSLGKLIGKAVDRNSSGGTVEGSQTGVRTTIELQGVESDVEEITLDTMENKIVENTQKAESLLADTDPEYKKLKTQEEKQEYIQSKIELINNNGFDLNATEGMTEEVYNQLKLVDQSQKTLSNIDTKIDENFTPKLKELYEGIRTAPSELKIQNLSRNLPMTASLAKQGITFEKMTDPQKNIVLSELAGRVGANSSGDVSEYAKRYSGNKVKGIDLNEVLPEDMVKQIEESKEAQDSSFWSGLGKTLGNYGVVAKNWGDLALDYTVTPWLNINKPKALQEERDKNWREKDEAWENSKKAAEELKRSFSNIGSYLPEGLESFTGMPSSVGAGIEDADVSDLELDDLGGNKGYNDIFGTGFEESLKSSVKVQEEQTKANFVKENAITFSPEREVDEQIVADLDAVAYAKAVERGGYVPLKNSKISLMPSDDPTKVTIGYQGVKQQDRDGKSELKDTEFVTMDIPLEDLAQNPSLLDTARMVSQRAGNWEFSPKNPKEFEQDIPYYIPESDDEAYKVSKSYLKRFGNRLSPEEREAFMTGDRFMSVPDIYKQASKKIEDPSQLQLYKQEVLDKRYSVKYTRVNGKFLLSLQATDPQNPEKKVHIKTEPTAFTDDFDIYLYSLRSSAFIQDYVKGQINQYR